MNVLPRSWHQRLRRGGTARLRGSLDLDRDSIPLDVTVRLEIEDGERLAIQLRMPLSDDPTDPGAPRLTSRELAIVRLICLGNDTGDIASALYISPATVRTHIRNAMSKVEARTRAQLVARLMAREREMLLLTEDSGDQ